MGTSAAARKSVKGRRYGLSLASAIRDSVSPDLFCQYHTAIIMGHDPIVTQEDNGDYTVSWDEKGEHKPDQETRTKSIQFLADRGWGTPVANIHLEANIAATMELGLPGIEPQQLPQLDYETRMMLAQLLEKSTLTLPPIQEKKHGGGNPNLQKLKKVPVPTAKAEPDTEDAEFEDLPDEDE